MPSFIEALGESINRASCVALGNAANTGELLNYVLEPLATNGTYNGAGALYAQRCGLPLPSGFSPQPAFTGGQCTTGQLYTVNVTVVTKNPAQTNPPSTSNQQFIKGAVVGIDHRFVGDQLQVDLISQSGARRDRLVTVPNAVSNQISFVSGTINSITRDGGAADNCGNVAPSVPPYVPGNNVVNTNVTYNDNSNNSVTIPVALAFGYASLNIAGNVIIPVNASFSANPVLNANFNLNFNTGDVQPDITNPNAPIPSPCSDPGGFVPDPSIPPPPASIPDAPPIPPTADLRVNRERLLKACIVTTSFVDGNESVIFQADNPDLYIPSLGYVQFKIRVGGSTAWTNDIPVKSLRTFIPCPWDGGAIDVRGTARYGNIFVVTPVYVTRTFNPTYPPES